MSEELVGSYALIEQLGSGAMGVVYRARHVRTGRAVALKTVRIPTARWLDSIRREIQALDRIQHPGIVRIVDHGVDRGRPWYAMELLEGETLRSFKNRLWSPFYRPNLPLTAFDVSNTEPVSSEVDSWSTAEPLTSSERLVPPVLRPPCAARQLETVLSIIRRLCATLAFLHGEGLINSDLKPENVLMVEGQPVIIDFGLATFSAANSGREALEPGRGVVGTLAYMSPEQFRGEFLDARSDLYSVGCMLYELLVGAPPFSGAPRQVQNQHQKVRPLPPSERVEGVPPALEQLVLKLLEKLPSDRFGHADEIAAELAELGANQCSLSEFPPPRPHLYRPRFVGRSDSIAKLSPLVERASLGSGSLILLGGESGVGKTRLAMELTRSPPGRALRVVTSEVASLGPDGMDLSAPLLTLRPLLKAIADACQEGGAAVTARVLAERRAVLSLYEPSLEFAPAEGELAPVIDLPNEASRRRLFDYLAMTLAKFTEEQPLIWVIDDVHRADELSVSFLCSLPPEFFRSHPLFLLCCYRSEESDALPVRQLLGLAHAARESLHMLDGAAMSTIVSDMLALRDEKSQFAEQIARDAGGNPFFVGEYLRAAVAESMLFRGPNDTWRIRNDSSSALSLTLPKSIRELVTRRLTKLGVAARRVVAAAATLGRECALDLLTYVAEISPEAISSALDELVRRNVLEFVDDARIRFVHDQLREATYSLAAVEQRLYHARAARWFVDRFDRQPGPHGYWASAGHHFALAGEARDAAECLELAGNHARATSAISDAIRLYREALAQVEASELDSSARQTWARSRYLGLHEALGDMLSLAGGRGEARAAYDKALTQMPGEDVVSRARVCRKIGTTWQADHRDEEARGFYDRALALIGKNLECVSAEARSEWLEVQLDKLFNFYFLHRVDEMNAVVEELTRPLKTYGSAAHRARFYQGLTMRDMRRDRYRIGDATIEFARAAVVECEHGAVIAELPLVRFAHGFALLFHGSAAPAEEELLRSLELAKRAGDAVLQARCFTYLAVVNRMLGQLDRVREFVELSLEMATGAATKEYLGAARANQAWLRLREQDDREALKHAEQALAIWDEFRPNFPFQWLALVPRLKLAERLADVEMTMDCIERLLASTQRALPEAVVTSLESAKRHYQREEHFGVHLERALNLLNRLDAWN